jgi:tetratricopeptide (TPR) repeat protein
MVPAPDRLPYPEVRAAEVRRMRIKTLQMNVRALAASLALVLMVVLVALTLVWTQEARSRRTVLRQVRQLREAGKEELAARHLSEYLRSYPDDVAVLEVQGELLAHLARSAGQLLEAARLNDRLVKLDPTGQAGQAARKRLVDLYVRFSDLHRVSAVYRIAPEIAANDLRYRAAEAIAREVVRRAPTDPEGHRLLATALEGLAVPGDESALGEAIREYETALASDPGDPVAAERLAGLYQSRRGDEARAERVLDRLIAARPELVEARLVRYRYFARARRPGRAADELNAAARLAPGDATVRLTVAGDALRRGDTAEARRQIEALPADAQDGLRVRMVRGLIDFGEERPDEAVDSWRKGLMRIGGSDAEMTWWLAYVLLQMGRLTEARPLVDQYRRLVGDDDDPLAQLLRAVADEKLSRPVLAILGLERVRDRVGDPWQTILHLTLGQCYEAIWDEERALAAYRRALQFDASAVLPRLAAARLLLERQPERAAAELERGVREFPDDPSFRVALAGALLKQQLALPSDRRSWGAFDHALARAAELAPGSPAVVLMRADRLSQTGGLADAAKLLEKAVKASPRAAALWVAWASALDRLGRPAEGLAALDRAADPAAVGDRAVLRVARARLLTALGRGREGRAQLIDRVDQLPELDRPPVWEESGRLLAAQGDVAGAREAYARWAGLQPDDPGPRLALLDLALSRDDRALVASTVAELRRLGGPGDVTWRLCRALELLRAEPAGAATPGGKDSGLDEAETLLAGVLLDAPKMPAPYLLRGELSERRGRDDKAVADYQRAWDLGNQAALPRLVDLLARLHRFDDVARLQQARPDLGLEQIAARAFARAGDADRAARWAEAASRSRPDDAKAQAWQVQVLAAVGRSGEAETVLRARAEARPEAEGPWLDLLRFQAENGRRDAADQTIGRARAAVRTDRPELFEARCRWVAGDRPAADRAFREALARWPDDVTGRLTAASYFEETGRPADAIACLRAVLDRDPTHRPAARQLAVLLTAGTPDPDAWGRAWDLVKDPDTGQGKAGAGAAPAAPEDRLARAVVLSRSSDPARRREGVGQLRALAGDLPAALPLAAATRDYLARSLLAFGDAEGAAEVAAITAAAGTSPPALALHAEALLKARRWDQAGRELDRLLALSPGDAAEAGLRARLVRDRAEPGKAAEDLERAYLDRGEGRGAKALGREVFRLLNEMGPEAAPVAERVARRLAASDPALSWASARLLLSRGDRDGALTLCRAAADAGSAQDLTEAARVAMEAATAPDAGEADRDRAAEVLQAALDHDPDAIDVRIMAAMLRHLQGRYADEAALYRGVLARRPGDVVAQNNLAWVLSEGLRDPSEGLTVVERLLRDHPELSHALVTRGVILIRLGRFPEAVSDLEQAAQRSPTALGQYYLALAYHKAGQADQAREAYRQARASGLDLAAFEPSQKAEHDALFGPR